MRTTSQLAHAWLLAGLLLSLRTGTFTGVFDHFRRFSTVVQAKVALDALVRFDHRPGTLR